MPCLFGAIFGDGVDANGLEDSRVSLLSVPEYAELGFVGQIRCDGVTKGSAVLLSVSLADQPAVPVVLTAGHVFSDMPRHAQSVSSAKAREVCGYRSRAQPWDTYAFSTRTVFDKKQVDSISHRFSSDWVVAVIDPWPNWGNYALKLDVDMFSSLDYVSKATSQSVMLVGYDTSENGLMIDARCNYGHLADSSIFYHRSKLVWDDCDSEQGSSGGALIQIVGDEIKLVGIRVGSLFDVKYYPHGPSPGDPFDINKNINVARPLDNEIRTAIKELLSP